MSHEGSKKPLPQPRQPTDSAAAERSSAPGTRPRTLRLQPRHQSSPAPVQQKRVLVADPAKEERARLTEQWMSTAMRPDLHPPPVLHKVGDDRQAAMPVQQKPDPARTVAHEQRAEITAQWLATAMRPDLHPPPVQRKHANEATNRATPVQATGGGQPMPVDVQAKMAHVFGAELSDVRIHQGPQAESLGALAYTQGTHIHFAPGQYDPHSRSGQELLGHELAHVVQQAQGRVGATTQAKGVDINDDGALEQEADEMGAKAARGEQVRETPGDAAPGTATARASKPYIGRGTSHSPRLSGSQSVIVQRQEAASTSEAGDDMSCRLDPAPAEVDAPTSEHLLARFQLTAKRHAYARLDQDEAKIAELRARYQLDICRPRMQEDWRRLRAILQLMSELEQQEAQLRDAIRGRREVLQTPFAFLFFELDQEQRALDADTSRLGQLEAVRAQLQAAYPELAAVDVFDISPETTNQEVYEEMTQRFDEVSEKLHEVREKIQNDDIPLAKLGVVIEEAKQELGVTAAGRQAGEPMSTAVLDWLDRQERIDTAVTWGTVLVGLLAFIGATVATGGTALVIAIAGAAAGLAGAAYEFEQFDDLNDAAYVGELTGTRLVFNPDEAKFNYYMGWVNLFLAGLDVAAAARAATQMARISRLDSATRQIQRMASSGQAEEANQLLNGLRTQLTDDEYARIWSFINAPRGARGGAAPLGHPSPFGTHQGVTSRRPFDPEGAGGPIRELTTDGVRITDHGVDMVERHVARFGADPANQRMMDRLRRIVRGELQPTQQDLNFYTHELRESVRYRRMGYRTGVPESPEDAHRLWNDTHTATLEDYGLSDRDLYHPEAIDE